MADDLHGASDSRRTHAALSWLVAASRDTIGQIVIVGLIKFGHIRSTGD